LGEVSKLQRNKRSGDVLLLAINLHQMMCDAVGCRLTKAKHKMVSPDYSQLSNPGLGHPSDKSAR